MGSEEHVVVVEEDAGVDCSFNRGLHGENGLNGDGCGDVGFDGGFRSELAVGLGVGRSRRTMGLVTYLEGRQETTEKRPTDRPPSELCFHCADSNVGGEKSVAANWKLHKPLCLTNR